MDVSDQRDTTFRANWRKSFCGGFVGYSTAYDFAPGLSQGLNLRSRRGNIPGIAVAHRLNGDRSVTSDGHRTNLDFTCKTPHVFFTKDRKISDFASLRMVITACQEEPACQYGETHI
jgi:hypothetical protein